MTESEGKYFFGKYCIDVFFILIKRYALYGTEL